jgi:hypothetical protein
MALQLVQALENHRICVANVVLAKDLPASTKRRQEDQCFVS